MNEGLSVDTTTVLTHHKRMPKLTPVLILLLLPWFNAAAETTLFLAGGGRLDDEVIQSFIALAGGPTAKIVVIPTASGNVDPKHDSYGRFKKLFETRGAKNVHIVHTRDKQKANDPRFLRQLEDANAIWFWGGRAARLASVYLNTETHRTLSRLFERGVVIGGTSSGSLIHADLLLHGDSENTDLLLGDHRQGFGFINDVALSVHFLARNRLLRFQDFLSERPHLTGIGIDEKTAIVVRNQVFEVVGNSYVVVYGIKGRNEPFTFLSEGDQFHLEKRQLYGNCEAWSAGCVEAE